MLDFLDLFDGYLYSHLYGDDDSCGSMFFSGGIIPEFTFVMIFVSWKNLRSVQRIYGTIWALISLLYLFGLINNNQHADNQLSAPVAAVEQKTIAMTTEEKLAKERADADAKSQKEAEAKAKKEDEAKAKAEAKAKEPIYED